MSMSANMTAAGVPRLAALNVSKAFDGRPAIDDVSFTVREREFVAVLGPSGAGKTTLFRCLTGLLAPDRGTVRVGDDDIGTLRGPARRRIAVVFQQFNLVNRLSAFENVLAGRLGYVPAWRGWLRCFTRADRLIALECLDRVGLLGHAQQRADTLSGGQQQRVAIARALALRPKVLLFDEPTSALDPELVGEVLDVIRELARSGTTLIIVTHEIGFAREVADRVVFIDGGEILEVGPPAQVLGSPCHARTREFLAKVL